MPWARCCCHVRSKRSRLKFPSPWTIPLDAESQDQPPPGDRPEVSSQDRLRSIRGHHRRVLPHARRPEHLRRPPHHTLNPRAGGYFHLAKTGDRKLAIDRGPARSAPAWECGNWTGSANTWLAHYAPLSEWAPELTLCYAGFWRAVLSRPSSGTYGVVTAIVR